MREGQETCPRPGFAGCGELSSCGWRADPKRWHALPGAIVWSWTASPANDGVLVCRVDGGVSLLPWRGKPRAIVASGDYRGPIAVSPDGELLALEHRKTYPTKPTESRLHVCAGTHGRRLFASKWSLTGTNGLLPAFSPDGTRLYVGDYPTRKDATSEIRVLEL